MKKIFYYIASVFAVHTRDYLTLAKVICEVVTQEARRASFDYVLDYNTGCTC